MASSSKKFQGQKRHSEDEPSTSHSLTGAGNKRFCFLTTNETEQRSLLEAKLLMTKVMDKLREIPHSNNEFLDYIKSKISKLEEGARKKTTVGVFGKSGVGKSSLINTILSEQDLLPSGTITACTSVIIQVESNTTDSSYTAEIDFIPKEEWRKEVENYLLSQGTENDDDDDDDDDDTMSTAQEKIEAVYGDIRANSTLEELMDEQNFIAIPEFLVSSKKTISCTTASELSEEINHFTTSDSSSDRSFWPMVKAVTIKIPSGRGFDNIALIDLPGTGDFNKSRDEMWKTCLSRCSTVWIVNDINRAASDKEPWKILTSCIKDMAHGGECTSITFICTKSDDIDYRAYMKSYKLKDEDLNVKATQDLQAYESQLKRACILHRNEKAKEKVRTVFSRQTEIQNNFICDKDFFKVFTVSSKVYQGEVATSILNEDTEIPALRRLLDKLDNSLHEASAKDYIQGAHGILSLIQGANSISSTTLKVKRDVRKALKRNLEEELYFLKAYLLRQSDRLDSCLSEGIVDSLNLSAETADKDVIKKNIKDARGYHRTLQALCENNGFRRTTNGVIIDLNASLATHMYKHVDGKFKELFPLDDPGVRRKPDKSIRGMLHKFNIINADMTELYKESPVSLNLLFIKTQQNKLISRIEDNICDRKKRIYNSLYQSILLAMLPVYPRAAEIHGKRSFTARQKLLTEHVEKAVTYMFADAKTSMMDLFQKLIEFINKTLREELDDILKHALAIKDGLPLPDVTHELGEIKALALNLTDL